MRAGRAEVQQLQVDLQPVLAVHHLGIVCFQVSMHQPAAVQHHKALQQCHFLRQPFTIVKMQAAKFITFCVGKQRGLL